MAVWKLHGTGSIPLYAECKGCKGVFLGGSGNEYTNRWFHNKGLEEKIHFLKNKKRKPFYSGITESNGVLYASQSLGDGSMEVVLLHSSFEKIRTLLNRQMMDDRMQVLQLVRVLQTTKL